MQGIKRFAIMHIMQRAELIHMMRMADTAQGMEV
jgi:hypothetical protein